jgi:N-acetylmuramate 1-kinase
MAAAIPHEALARAVRAAFGAATTIVAAEPLAGDASSRRYVRLRLSDGAAPPTAVAVLLGADRLPLGSDAILRTEISGTAENEELPFVNVGRWLAAHGFGVPTLHHHAAADGLLILEDVGNTTLWAAANARPADARRLFAAAVDLLVALQVAGARHPDPSCRAFGQRFDGHLARWELAHFVEHGIETRHRRTLDRAERAALLAALEPLAAPFETAEPVLVHRDFMAWNIHVQGGRLRLIDFQDALLGPDAYDLAALLTDRTTGALIDAGLEAELLAHFTAARARSGLPVTGDLAERYRSCALQRALKVIGRFHYLECVLGKPGYLAYLPGVYAVARRMLDALPALAPARARLAAHVPELA